MTRSATKACIACRDRKRRCDRIVPSCSLCYRLGRRCQYESRVHLPSQASIGSIINLPSRLSPPSINPLSSHGLFDEGAFIRTSINNTITEKLLRSVGDASAVRNAATRYFKSIHLWFPVVSEHSFYERLTNIYEKPCADYSLLSLSMMLITTLPPVKDTLDSFASLYILVKSSIAIVEAANINSLEVVQARLLVSLFEFGHGISAAFISIAATVRAAVALGLNEAIKMPSAVISAASPKLEEGLRVWWGVVMLDRNYTLERGEGPCATQGLGTPRHLPRENISDQKDWKSNKSPDQEESDQIARTLTAFSLLLPEETPQPWPRYCGAIGMCYNALMTLQESRQNPASPIDVGDSGCPEALSSALIRMNYIAAKFNEKIDQVDLEAISPFPPRGLSKAVSIQYRLWKQTGDAKWLESSDSIKLMLSHFSKRWMNAAKLLGQVEAERKSDQALLVN